ncbi:MAG: geranylgeranylglyceryl/heptaprenylglyceryl phosphate synthase [Candidatus Bathyarchaeia archaeon]
MNPPSPGKVERRLLDGITNNGAIHLALLDPEEFDPERASSIVKALERAGSAAVMLGGSTVSLPSQISDLAKRIRAESGLPIILFPNGISGVVGEADAIFFMSLMNSTNPYYIVGAQALAAPLVKRFGLEAIPMGYIIIGGAQTSVSFIGQANPIPQDKPDIAAMYALAAQYMGMRFVYLEAGSGAKEPVRPEVIKRVKEVVDIPVIVGGGISTPELAEKAVGAGADAIVTGTAIEGGDLRRIVEIIGAVRRYRALRG